MARRGYELVSSIRRMGLLRKRSADEKELASHCQAVGNAVAKSAVGNMPPDFATDVVDGSRIRIQELYQRVLAESGPKIAHKASVDTARKTAEGFAHGFGVPVGPVGRQAAEAVTGIVD